LAFVASLEVGLNGIKVVLDLVEESDVLLDLSGLLLVPLVLLLVLEFVLFAHRFVHLVYLVVHLASNLSLAPHLSLLLLLPLFLYGLVSDLSLLALLHLL